MAKKLNGVHTAFALEAKPGKQVKQKEITKNYKLRNLKTSRSYEKARATLLLTSERTMQFKGLSGTQILIVIEAAMKDSYIPMGRKEARRGGGHYLTQALKQVRYGEVQLHSQK